MPRVQPVLTDAENTLIENMSKLTQAKRSDVIRNALAVYHWFIRQAMTGAQVVARKPNGEEIALETPELSALEALGQKLTPEELGLLSTKLAEATDEVEAARLRERLTRGFYGV